VWQTFVLLRLVLILYEAAMPMILSLGVPSVTPRLAAVVCREWKKGKKKNEIFGKGQ